MTDIFLIAHQQHAQKGQPSKARDELMHTACVHGEDSHKWLTFGLGLTTTVSKIFVLRPSDLISDLVKVKTQISLYRQAVCLQ